MNVIDDSIKIEFIIISSLVITNLVFLKKFKNVIKVSDKIKICIILK